ncbi:branched-chain amino acid transport system II carrier protein [Conchiformibius steedae]|uniref:branched-chain amino acid transport system II carrier protein n=1 Tax=Conchiformibius steedae TaxID=153493 RepID=UPI0026ECF111|nr:branched-chain amino acid transport system II carrier protein [Conchiformibius steedae]
MNGNTHKSAFVATGLMLFALFFGAGNLIFPALMGQQAGSNVFTAMAGFLLTGAGLPLLGVIAVGYSGSRDVQEMASRVAPWFGVAFAVSLYLAIGPLFATPRTATVSFGIGVEPFLNLEGLDEKAAANQKSSALAGFSLVFFALSYWLSVSPGKLVDRIGKILTPALLVSIAILVGYAALAPMGAPPAPAEAYQQNVFAKGMIEGYGTMDALASLVFAIIVIEAVRGMGVSDKKQILSLTTRAGLVAAGCLAVVYVFIAYMGATSVAGIEMQESGAAVLAKSAEHYFGGTGKVLLAIIVFLACLSTSVGLITACGEYFNRLLPKITYHQWVVVFTLVSLVFANFGLSNLIKYSVPVLMLLYPLTVALIALVFLHNLFGGQRLVYVTTMLFTLPMALFDGWKTLHGMLEGSKDALVMQWDASLKGALPLYESGLGWVLPALAGLIIGMLIARMIGKKA